MPKRRSDIGRRTRAAKRCRLKRLSLKEEEKCHLLEKNRHMVQERRKNETAEKRSIRQARDRERQRERRKNETAEQRSIRLARDRERQRVKRLSDAGKPVVRHSTSWIMCLDPGSVHHKHLNEEIVKTELLDIVKEEFILVDDQSSIPEKFNGIQQNEQLVKTESLEEHDFVDDQYSTLEIFNGNQQNVDPLEHDFVTTDTYPTEFVEVEDGFKSKLYNFKQYEVGTMATYERVAADTDDSLHDPTQFDENNVKWHEER